MSCARLTVGPSRLLLCSQILKLLKGKVLVGHALHNDFQALKYIHPRGQTRDTTYVPSLLSQPSLHARTRVSLKDLALQLLHKKIQVHGAGGLGEREGLASMLAWPWTGRGLCLQRASPSPGAPACPHSPGCFLSTALLPQRFVTASHTLPGCCRSDLSPTQFLALSPRLHVEPHLLQPSVRGS